MSPAPGSCCPLTPTPEPSPSPFHPGPARGGRHLSSCPLGLCPIRFIHIHGDAKDCPGSLGSCSCASWATLVRSRWGLSPPGPGGAQALLGPSCSFSTAPSSPGWKSLPAGVLTPRGFPLGSAGSPFESRRLLKMHKTGGVSF